MSGGGHFAIRIVSEAVEGRSLIQQHKLVHEVVGYPMDGRIHALEIKTIKPSRWDG
jgi:BolA protein